MNWRRGFLRAWILLSVVWVLVASGYELNRWNDYFNGIRSLRAECQDPKPPPWCLDWSQLPPANFFDQFDADRPNIRAKAAFIAAPPATLLLCGLAIGWVLLGFRRSGA
jgi:hypothetical protein